MIKVVLADDSALTRAVVRDIFSATPDISVVGEAENGRDAVALTELLKPDLVIMDLLMPVMDGLASIEEIMDRCPTPILVLSATVDEREVSQAFSAIRKGALDVMEKPAGTGLVNNCGFGNRLVEKTRLLARIRVIHHRRRRVREELPLKIAYHTGELKILAIGASTGGPKAVMSIVRTLPADFAASVLIVQHIATGFAKGFVHWLNSESRMQVRLAADGDPVAAGGVLVAPNDCHMVVESGRIRLTADPPVNCCRPSIDVLFHSLAEEFGAQTVGVLLTGMGRDGARGLLHIKAQGGVTIVQDEESSAVFGMPKAAIGLNAADEVLPLTGIPTAVARHFSLSRQAG
ncbi:MAG TPA: chemotaxis-specific protein-glutamate methyltransferase CheB [Geobacteraceae bacterium]